MSEERWIKKHVEDFRSQLDSSGSEVFAFFICFSKFECALKKAGYTCWKWGKLSPNWDGFARDIASEFDKQIAQRQGGILIEAVEYFKKNPPKKQILEDGRIDWKDVKYDGGSLLIWLNPAIRRVRNNLFHGGKYPLNPNVDEPARDSLLLNHSLVILQECLDLCGSEKFNEDVRNRTRSVRESFEEAIE